MASHRVRTPIIIAAVAGVALWFTTSMLTGQREAWDSSLYWSVTYPAALVTCAVLGYAYPRRSWLWALVLFASQFVAMLIQARELGNLWPLGLAMIAIMSLPGVWAARIAARFSGASREEAA